MVLGATEADVRVAELRLRETLVAAEAERRMRGLTRPPAVGRGVVGVCNRLGAALVPLGLRLQGPARAADALPLPGERGARA